MKELTKWHKESLTNYPVHLALRNAYLIRSIFKHGMEYIFHTHFTLTNDKKDMLYINYRNNMVIVKLMVGNKYINITELMLAKNKYGSAVIKRFFKDYKEDVYEHITTYINNRNAYYVDNLKSQLDPAVLPEHLYVADVRYVFINKKDAILNVVKDSEDNYKSKLVLASKCSAYGDVVVNNNPTDDELKDFFSHYLPKQENSGDTDA